MRICGFVLLLASIIGSYAGEVDAGRRGEVETLLWSNSFQPSMEEYQRWRDKLVSTPGIKEELMAIVREGSEGKGNYETIGKAFHILSLRKDVTEKDEEELLGPLRMISRKEGRETPYESTYAQGGVGFLKGHYSESGESILIEFVSRNQVSAIPQVIEVLGKNGSMKAVSPLRELQKKHQPNPHTDEDIYQLVDVAVQNIERREKERQRSR